VTESYEWRWCKTCNIRIFKDEKEGDTIKTVGDNLYCIDCAEELGEECECGSGELVGKDDECCKFCFDEDAIIALASNQEPLIVVDGVAQIDSSHPDYKFWTEDD